MRKIANCARVAVLLGGMIAAAGSATSNPPPPAQWRQAQPAPGAQPQYTPCQYACGQMMRCQVQAYDACMLECAQSGAEQQPGGADQLYAISRTSCQQLAQMSQQSHQPPPAAQQGNDQRQWRCDAMGSWQKCETSGTQCYPQSSNAFGFGATEQLARGAAESQCSSAMAGLMSANFTYRTSVTAPCRSTSCTPP